MYQEKMGICKASQQNDVTEGVRWFIVEMAGMLEENKISQYLWSLKLYIQRLAYVSGVQQSYWENAISYVVWNERCSNV